MGSCQTGKVQIAEAARVQLVDEAAVGVGGSVCTGGCREAGRTSSGLGGLWCRGNDYSDLTSL